MIHYVPNQALADSILRALGRGQELRLRDVGNYVRNDYGTVSWRAISRYLSAMVRRGDVLAGGVRNNHSYQRPIARAA